MEVQAKVGRPSSMTEEVCDEICALIAEGESLRAVCRIEGMPSKATVLRWLRDNASFRAQYAEARARGMDAMAEDLIEIADDGTNDTYVDDQGNVRTDHDVIARSKLRIDTRKWLMSKLAPKKYGDKIDVTSDGKELAAPIVGMLVRRREDE